MIEGYMTTAQTAERLRVSLASVFRYIAQAALPAIKVSNMWLIPTQAVESFSRPKLGRPKRK